MSTASGRAVIRQADVIASVAGALQHMSYAHPPDFVRALGRAWAREDSPLARDAIAQILASARLSVEHHRPICQDTGIVVVFAKVGTGVEWDAELTLQEMVDEGVRRAYGDPANPLRPSIVADPLGSRANTRDNTPAVLHVELVAGNVVTLHIAAKGGGSENKARFTVLNPSDDVAEWVVREMARLGAGWCPPGILAVGVGGTAEKAMLLAKEALLDPIDIDELQLRGIVTADERLRLTLYERLNALGIGAQGLGGRTTVLDVKVRTYPTHAASMPVALIPNCGATRHHHFVLDGSGPAVFAPPNLADWPDIQWTPAPGAKRIDLGTLTRADMQTWRAGDRLLLSGTVLTARDAAHKRIADLVATGQELPPGLDFRNRFVYYVGPVDPIGSEVVGPAGPTTATRMDKFSDLMFGRLGLAGAIGKAERGPTAIEAIRAHRGVSLIAVGGAAYLVSRAIRSSRVIAFPDLGMEAIREFVVDEMPVVVAVDSRGENIHDLGPRAWRSRTWSLKAVD